MQTTTARRAITVGDPSHLDADAGLCDDVRGGLSAAQNTPPSKYFYDARGSELFDAICRTPVADFETGLRVLPPTIGKLIVFLGSTIGNCSDTEVVGFLRTARAAMGSKELFLLGTDLVKDEGVLNAAYNDASGIPAEFNKNVLRVLNRKLDAEFALDTFTHRAFYRADMQRIEMHLVSSRDQTVRIGALDWTVQFCAGESIRVEISRKFTPAYVRELLGRAGMDLCEYWPSDDNYFALSLGRRTLGVN